MGLPVEAEASKLTLCPGAGVDGEKVKLAARFPPLPPLIATLLLPTAVPQALFFAVIVFVPEALQVSVIELPDESPVPPPFVQVQPSGAGVQLVAVAVKVNGWLT